MGMILNSDQSARIKAIRKEIRNMHMDGWMVEGYDEGLDIMFNNDLDCSIIFDYNGRVVNCSRDTEITPDLKRLMSLYGQIRKIEEE